MSLVLKSSSSIRTAYDNKPISLLRTVAPGMKFPKKIAYIFALIWMRQDSKGRKCNNFILAGPRGGGKTMLLGSLGFCEWFLKSRSIVDMGGSFEQAKGVYKYFSGIVTGVKGIIDDMKKEPLMHYTEGDKKNFFKAVGASTKQVRGPHPDDLFVDEACEADNEIIYSAMPMVDSSDDPLRVVTSTFHQIFGFFQETWDNAEDLGYMRFSWDVFDVTKVFDPKIWDDPELNRQIDDLHLLKERTAGRVGDPEGWVSIENIIQAWRQKQSIDWFDIEYMGSRPSAHGLVNDPVDVEACTVPDNEYSYKKGATVIGALDWGWANMTSLVVLMEHIDGLKVQLENKNYTRTKLEIIVEDTIELVIKYRIEKIYADSAGTFENDYLQNKIREEIKKQRIHNFSCTVVPVVFSARKQDMLSNYRAHFQRHLLAIPESHKTAIIQHKSYRYAKDSDKVLKQDDHIPDATQCALEHWPLVKAHSGFPEENLRAPRSGKVGGTITGGLKDEQF